MANMFHCGRYRYSLGDDKRPLVMGILNITPDSFSDGGQFLHLENALMHAEQMLADGVDIIDIGGESTRPGSVPATLEQELARVIPVIYALRDCGVPLSIDTNKPQVMREALLAGADMINDIHGFASAEAVAAVAGSEAGLCIMHMQKSPTDMQLRPDYADVCREVSDFLSQQAGRLIGAGIDARQICIDPGFGFGKTLEHNISLFRDIGRLQQSSGLPVLVGVSRKTMLGQITGRPVEQRGAASIAAAIAAASHGAKIVRVHDVAATVDALKIWQQLQR